MTEIEIRDSAVMQQAEAAIAAFERQNTPGAWVHLDKATLIAQIRDCIRYPYLINQGGQPFCGSAAVLFEWFVSKPCDISNFAAKCT